MSVHPYPENLPANFLTVSGVLFKYLATFKNLVDKIIIPFFIIAISHATKVILKNKLTQKTILKIVN